MHNERNYQITRQVSFSKQYILKISFILYTELFENTIMFNNLTLPFLTHATHSHLNTYTPTLFPSLFCQLPLPASLSLPFTQIINLLPHLPLQPLHLPTPQLSTSAIPTNSCIPFPHLQFLAFVAIVYNMTACLFSSNMIREEYIFIQ